MAASACACVAIFGGLSLQMAAGKDPALGPKAQALAAVRNAPSNKRIIKRKVIIRKVYPAETESSATAYASGSGSGYSAPAPSYSAPAPSYSAPAPAPVTTSTS